ncbi:MAG TPA: hypothetical protein VIK78_04475 [Ruminiclostridium sp.]
MNLTNIAAASACSLSFEAILYPKVGELMMPSGKVATPILPAKSLAAPLAGSLKSAIGTMSRKSTS